MRTSFALTASGRCNKNRHMNSTAGVVTPGFVLRTLFAAVLSACSCSAALFYVDASSFMANIGPGYYLEDFEGLQPGALTEPVTFSNLGFSYSATVGSGPPGLFAIEYATEAEVLSVGLSIDAPANRALKINFISGNVSAVGGNFFLTNSDGLLEGGELSVSLSDGTTVFLNSSAEPPLTFRGFVTTGGQWITSLTVTPPSTGDYFPTIDNFIVGQAVPEPEAWGPGIALGCLGFAFYRKLRRC